MLITVFTLLVLLFSIVIHEIAHGSVALHLGDNTAKYAGRLTLNPLKHLDPVGSLLVPLMLLILTAGQGPVFGWARPVPINPMNFNDRKWGSLKVAIAGPVVNFFIALFFGLIIRLFTLPEPLFIIFGIITIYNFLWGLFNLIPIPPLDGSHIVFSLFPISLKVQFILQQYGFFILILFLFSGGIRFLSVGAQYLFYLTTGHLFGI